MPTGRQTPLSMFTDTPGAYDTKARLGAEGNSGYPLPEDTIPGEPLKMVDQNNNGMKEPESKYCKPDTRFNRPVSPSNTGFKLE